MTANLPRPRIVRTKGEPFVWMCSMGLALGLLMVAALLGLIVWQGISVFWPREVLRFTLRPGVSNGVNDQPVIGGEFINEQVRKSQTGGSACAREWQIFTGNRDTYGFSFKYLNAGDVVRVDT